MIISTYSQQLIKNNGFCHTVSLVKNGQKFTGIYNGLSNWGRVENENGELVEKLSIDPEEDGFQPNFYGSSFEEWGYEVLF